jgi:hypothetical protein
MTVYGTLFAAFKIQSHPATRSEGRQAQKPKVKSAQRFAKHVGINHVHSHREGVVRELERIEHSMKALRDTSPLTVHCDVQ